MAVKRRIIWMTDDEWEVLKEAAKKNHHTISQEIRNIWTYADRAADQRSNELRTPEEVAWAEEIRGVPDFWEPIPGKLPSEIRPPVIRPVPKVSARKIPRQK